MSVPRNLRYSPVNYLIVDWGMNDSMYLIGGAKSTRTETDQAGAPEIV